MSDQAKEDDGLPELRKEERAHPLFGALKEVTFIVPGLDLTLPADPDWGLVSDQDPKRLKRAG